MGFRWCGNDFWDDLGIVSGWCWDDFGMFLVCVWDGVGFIFGWVWDDFEMTVGWIYVGWFYDDVYTIVTNRLHVVYIHIIHLFNDVKICLNGFQLCSKWI